MSFILLFQVDKLLFGLLYLCVKKICHHQQPLCKNWYGQRPLLGRRQIEKELTSKIKGAVIQLDFIS